MVLIGLETHVFLPPDHEYDSSFCLNTREIPENREKTGKTREIHLFSNTVVWVLKGAKKLKTLATNIIVL